MCFYSYSGVVESHQHEEVIGLLIEPAIRQLDDEATAKYNKLKVQWKIHAIQMTNRCESVRECEIELATGKSSKIGIVEIPKDGNCIFGASIHQLYHLEIGSDLYHKQVLDLRKIVVTHIRENFEKYEADIMNRIYEKCNKKKSEIEDIKNECEKYIDGLSNQGNWGGLETVKAISAIFKANVIIFNEGGVVYAGNSFDPLYENIISLVYRFSYRLDEGYAPSSERNHYDSVVGITDDVLNECCWLLIRNYTKTCSFKNQCDVIELD